MLLFKEPNSNNCARCAAEVKLPVARLFTVLEETLIVVIPSW
jgi:hypothetical protein